MSTSLNFEDVLPQKQAFANGLIQLGHIGPVGVILLNQPAKRNSISLAMWEGICESHRLLQADPNIHAVIYAGAGGQAFSAGADISEFASQRDGAAGNERYNGVVNRSRALIAAFTKPTVACIQGYCLGGGLGTAMQADLRVSAADAVFGIPATKMGLHFGIEPSELLVSLVGPARAKLILFSGRRFGAAEAYAMGLVDQVAQQDAVQESLALAQAIAENAPLSVQASKFTIAQSLRERADRDLAALAAHTQLCLDSSDYREARTAFMEKRKARFTGR